MIYVLPASVKLGNKFEEFSDPSRKVKFQFRSLFYFDHNLFKHGVQFHVSELTRFIESSGAKRHPVCG